MIIIDKTILGDDELIIDETAGVITLEVKGELLGTPEDVKITLSAKTVFLTLLAGVTNPIAKSALAILINLFT